MMLLDVLEELEIVYVFDENFAYIANKTTIQRELLVRISNAEPLHDREHLLYGFRNCNAHSSEAHPLVRCEILNVPLDAAYLR